MDVLVFWNNEEAIYKGVIFHFLYIKSNVEDKIVPKLSSTILQYYRLL